MSVLDISISDLKTMTRSSDTPSLKPAVFHILLALADQDRHGYAIMQAVRDQSGGQVPLRTGSFYRHLSRLIDDGFVVETPTRPAGDDPRRGTYYRLTPLGVRVLARERDRLSALVASLGALRPRRRPA
jgi:DNA-binding PadR family transcriptional regulator